VTSSGVSPDGKVESGLEDIQGSEVVALAYVN
jgi:hypothetical protein